jgi:LacI family transcriptional regulator
LGLRVPADVSVVGFDDVLGAELYDPPLTVIAQPVYDIGHRAIELLTRRVAAPGAPNEEVMFATHLLIRGSTAPAWGRDKSEEV